MKRKPDDRFVVVYQQGDSALKLGNGITQIWIDRVTGVNYLYISHSMQRGGGLTPLLDANGKPIVTPVENL